MEGTVYIRTGASHKIKISWKRSLFFVTYFIVVNAAIYREILEHFLLLSVEKLYGDADFLFQQDFSTCP